MIRYRIIKTKPDSTAEVILLHPAVEGDKIYEYDTLEDAEIALLKIREMSIYAGIQLSIVTIIYDEET